MSAPWATDPPSAFDPTAVIGRRIGAWALDVLLVLVLAGGAGAIVWFSSATLVEGAGARFCERINDTAPDLGDPVVEIYDVGYSCLQVNDDAYVASNDDTGRALMVAILIALLIPLNLFLVQGLTGASVGKHLFGLRVVRATGQIAGFGWNALRTLLLLFATFPCGIVLMPAELIVAAVTKRHQRVGDMAAGTYVVRTASVGTPIGAPGTIAGVPAPSPTPTPAWGAPSAPPPSPGWGTAAPTWGTTPPTTPSSAPGGAAMPSEDETSGATPATPAAGDSLTPSPAVGAPTPADVAATEVPESGAPSPAAPSPAAPSPVSPSPVAASPVAASAGPPAGTPALPPGAEMRWDERWNAWLYWDPSSQRWLRHDPAANQWIPL
jgi:hypothetical protein